MNEHHPQVWRPTGPARLNKESWGWICTCGMGGSGLTEDQADLDAESHVQDAIDRGGRNWRAG